MISFDAVVLNKHRHLSQFKTLSKKKKWFAASETKSTPHSLAERSLCNSEAARSILGWPAESKGGGLARD